MPRSEVAARRELSASHRMMQVTEREVQRILLDIHGGPVQHMYAALSQLDLLRRALDAPGGQAEARERIERIRLLLEGGLNEVRSFIGAFRPPEFETRELVTLLEGLAPQHEAMTDTRLELDVRGALPDKFHLQNVYLKLGVRNRAEAAAYYLRTRGGAARPRGGKG